MQKIGQVVGLVYRGLFLHADAYDEMRDARNPFVEGLFVLVLIGLVVAASSIIGATLEWASSPSLAAIQHALYDGLTNMPWYDQLKRAIGPDFATEFQAQWNRLFGLAQTIAPTPLTSLASLITTPLGFMISWFIYGLLAHLFARLLGGSGSLSQTLGSTGLAMAPHLLKVVGLLPFVTVGGVVGTWVLVCRYVALKQTHGLSWGRAFWATILPRVVTWLLVVLLVGLGIALLSVAMPRIDLILGRLAR
jgi:hypothetical protein